jgi:5'-nucleotidase
VRSRKTDDQYSVILLHSAKGRAVRILITNDDGYFADGIQALAKAARAAGHDVWVVAPDREQSACSHKLTLHEPLRMTQISTQGYTVTGTPTDAIYLALFHIMPQRPDLLISGINRGPNLGDDLTYSGTVAGAMEGAVVGLPSISISVAGFSDLRWDTASAVALELGEHIVRHPMPARIFLNVNVPPALAPEDARLRVTRLGRRDYKQTVVMRADPRGRDYFWIGGDAMAETENHSDSDVWAIEHDFVSVTPVTLDMTHDAGLAILKPIESIGFSKTETDT